QTKQEDFQRSVNEAIGNVVQRIEKREAVSFINNRYSLSIGQNFFYQQSSTLHISSGRPFDSLLLFPDIKSATSAKNPEENQQADKKVIGIWTMSDTNEIHYAVDDSNRLMVGEVNLDSSGTAPSFQNRVKIKADQWNDIIYQMVMEWSNVQLPIEERLQPD